MEYVLRHERVQRREGRRGRFTYRASGLGFLGPELELDGELPDELSEEVLVAVLGELVHHEPVRHLTLGQDVLQALGHVLVVLVSDLISEIRCHAGDNVDFTVLNSW